MSLKLLLATERGEPYLKQDLPLIQAAQGERPEDIGRPLGPSHLADDSANPNALAAQRWSVLVPEEGGDELLERIRPLIELRQNEQGGPICSYAAGKSPIVEGRPFKVPRGQSAQQAAQWIQDNLNRIPYARRPHYLLLLGGPDQISLELQQALSVYYFVGRVAFPTLDGYSDYAAKVVAYARPERWQSSARALTYAVRTKMGIDAPDDGYTRLLVPVQKYTEDALNQCALSFKDVSPAPGLASARGLLDCARVDSPTILLSVSHGQGRSNAWSDEEQRRFQGQMSFGCENEPLSADLVRRGAFLPGGMWFYFACYGAGTPAISPYHHWLQRLPDEYDVLRSLPRNGVPFLSTLPLAALANPQGPLAVIGHMDLAWNYSYDGRLTIESASAQYGQDPRTGERSGHVERMAELTKLARRSEHPSRIGPVFRSVLGDLPQVQDDLVQLYDRDAARGDKSDAGAIPLQRAKLWMLRQDLRAYVLLGDPAAYLPVQRRPQPVVSTDPVDLFGFAPTDVSSAARTDLDLASVLTGVLDCIREEKTPKAVASALQVDKAEVEKWRDVYMQAGRAALARMLGKD